VSSVIAKGFSSHILKKQAICPEKEVLFQCLPEIPWWKTFEARGHETGGIQWDIASSFLSVALGASVVENESNLLAR
jgi:hypothetical protein